MLPFRRFAQSHQLTILDTSHTMGLEVPVVWETMAGRRTKRPGEQPDRLAASLGGHPFQADGDDQHAEDRSRREHGPQRGTVGEECHRDESGDHDQALKAGEPHNARGGVTL